MYCLRDFVPESKIASITQSRHGTDTETCPQSIYHADLCMQS